MLPGFDDGRREDVPKAFLDAFGPDDDRQAASAPPAEAEAAEPAGTGAREEDHGADAHARPAAEAEARGAGRHRQRNRRGRGPALAAAAAVGAVLAAVPFLSPGSGSGRDDTQGRTAPTATMPDDVDEPETPEGVRDTTEPVAFAGAEDATERKRGTTDTPHGGGSRVVGTRSEEPSPPRTGKNDTTEPVKGVPDRPEDKPVYEGTVVTGTHVVQEGQPVVAGGARLSMEPDGNFVVRDGSGVVRWAANTATLGSRAVFQGDGNLVVVTADGRAVWHSATGGNPGARLILQKSGRMLITSATGVLLWSTDSRG